jgi:N-acetylglucosamine kinase-like BadF-type ATPase
MSIFVGVDGGGSKTEALMMDHEGHVLGIGRSGRSNYQICGMEMALTHIRAAVEQALQGRSTDHIVYCLAGADTSADFARLEPELHTLHLGQTMVLYNDVQAIFRAGSRQPYGMAVVCGTGFNAGGIGPDKREFRLPALGAMTGDIGGGEWIGISALGAAYRAWDGRGPQTQLGPAILQSLQMPDMETLAARISQEQILHAQILDLVPLVFEAAAQGDEPACEIIRRQGQEIGLTIMAVLRRLDLLDIPCDVVLGGSVFNGQGALLMDTVYDNLHAPYAELKRLDQRPVIGAALLAADHAGLTAGPTFIDTLLSSFLRFSQKGGAY